MNKMMEDSERAVREILTGITLNEDCRQHATDAPLDQTGIDSVGMIELVYALETRFAIEIGDEEVAPENFSTIGSVAALVASKCH